MDLRDLNSHQILLLTILVSFVTSIATGIMTASLLNEAPQTLTQTINRVVERTVEKVVPGDTPSIITKKVTVVVKEEDLVVDAVEKNLSSVVRIGELVEAKTADTEAKYEKKSIGFVVSGDGLILADSRKVTKDTVPVLVRNKWLEAEVVARDEANNVVLLRAKNEGSQSESKTFFQPVVLADAKLLKPGQKAIAFGGTGGQAIQIGIVTSVIRDTPEEGEVQSVNIKTNLNPDKNAIGSPVLNLDGEVVGVLLLTSAEFDAFALSDAYITKLLSEKSETIATAKTLQDE